MFQKYVKIYKKNDVKVLLNNLKYKMPKNKNNLLAEHLNNFEGPVRLKVRQYSDKSFGIFGEDTVFFAEPFKSILRGLYNPNLKDETGTKKEGGWIFRLANYDKARDYLESLVETGGNNINIPEISRGKFKTYVIELENIDPDNYIKVLNKARKLYDEKVAEYEDEYSD